MAKYELLAPQANYQVTKVLLAAKYADVDLKLKTMPAAELTALLPHAKSLILRVTTGNALASGPELITRSNTVLRYLAELRPDLGLYGKNIFESALVDQWLDFSFNQVEVPAALVDGIKKKKVEVSAAVASAAEAGVQKALNVLDDALEKSTFLAGDRVTIADLAVLTAVMDIVKGEPSLATRLPSFGRWFLTLLHQPHVASLITDAPALIKATNKATSSSTIMGTAVASSASAAALSASSSSSSSTLAPTLTGPPGRFDRGRVVIKNLLLVQGKSAIGQEIRVKGWARTIREANKGELLFVDLTDGSCSKGLQVVLEKSKTEGFASAVPSACGGVGASFDILGTVVESPAKGQAVELHGSKVTILGKVYGEEGGKVGAKYYPLSKKAHSMEFLRSIQHLRPRSRIFGAVARIRHAMSFATHKFFNERGFNYVHTPLTTSADCEGAGEQFLVTTLVPEGKPVPLPTLPNGHIDYSKDFFGRRTCLTVSGQLHVESFACALSDVYTFGPTFRAENSHTTRHLAEFWMIEPEIAFATLEDDINLAEDYLKFLVHYALTYNDDDLELFEKVPGGEVGLRERLRNVLDNPFERITYTKVIDLLQAEIKAGKVKFEEYPEWGCDLGSEHERYVSEKVFKKPVVVTNYPKEIKAFYMRLDEDGKTVSAMDILVPKIGEIIGGSQREERLDVLEEKCKAIGLDPKSLYWYLDLRRYGSVPHAGFGLGFERLILFITGLENIRDVIPFPRYPGHADI